MKPKERILNMATQLFHQHGYNATGINEIIEKANVAKASFYQHFKSKEDLAVEYLETRHQSWFEGLKQYTNEKETIFETVIAAFNYIKYMNEEENFRGCCFLNMLSEIQTDNTRLFSIIQSHKTDLQDFFIAITKDEKKAFIIYMLFEACIIESQVYRTQKYIEETIDNIHNLI